MSDFSSILLKLEQTLAGSLDCPAELGSHLKSFLHGSGATDVVNELLAAYLRTWDVRMLERLDGESFLLLQNERFAVSLKLVTKPSDLLNTPGVDRFTVFRSPAPVMIDRYRISGRFDPDVFDPGATLELDKSWQDDGSCLYQSRAEPFVHDYHAPAPILVAQLVRYPASSQIWFFHRETRRAAFPVVGYMELSSYVLLSRMIAAMGERRALPLLEELTANGSHVVRWAAIQAIGKLDGAAGRAQLQRALSDPHPHISSAAAKTLAKIAG
jgi:hypothetical protein